MSVYRNKQRDGEWRYNFYIGKQRFFGPCLDKDGQPVAKKSEALAAEELAKVAARQQISLAKSGIRPGVYTFAQASALYLQRKNGKTDFANHKRYVHEIRNFEAFAGGAKAMRDITLEDCEGYKTFCGQQTVKKWIGGAKRKKTDAGADRFWKDTGRPRSPREINNYLKCLKAVLTIGTKVRDPITRQPILDDVPEIRLQRVPRRQPRPIGDNELEARLGAAKPWTREAAELARLFGLRKAEALTIGRRHVDREIEGLRFDAGETKSGNDEFAFGGEAGWQLLLELEAQAISRGVEHLITWPGPKKWRAWLRGEEIKNHEWRHLKGIERSWRSTAKRAGIVGGHTFHKIRARFITEVAKVQPAAAQEAARHRDASTTALYIKLAATEIRDAVRQANARRPALKAVK